MICNMEWEHNAEAFTYLYCESQHFIYAIIYFRRKVGHGRIQTLFACKFQEHIGGGGASPYTAVQYEQGRESEIDEGEWKDRKLSLRN